ncbi:MAG TPA: hypothetical protein DCF91_11725 [Porphyromonadaceae bacterium]|nr:hypothetical protein [Porphyromonadaceae bacterium]
MKNIDVHCHLFNSEIASFRILWDLALSIIHTRDFKTTNTIERKGSAKEPANKLKLLFLLFQKSSAVLKYLEKYEPNTIFAPLMFDLKYAAESSEAQATIKELVQTIQDEINSMQNEKSLESNNFTLSKDPILDDKIDFYKTIIKNTSRNYDLDSNKEKAFGFFSFKKDTFDDQYNQLVQLKLNNPHTIMPFIAVDPRRPDIYERMVTAIERDGFCGVKLYCPNGYSPLDPRLENVYKYCIEHQIPITAHCSYGGVATAENSLDIKGAYFHNGKIEYGNKHIQFKMKLTGVDGIEERAYALNHPALWNEVLEKNKGLILNLAHMGARTTNDMNLRYEWTYLIVLMMQKYETLYTDVSCRTDKETLQKLWEIANEGDKNCEFSLKVTDRVMFGTDFWLSMLSENLQTHLSNFDEVFQNDSNTLQRLKQINPARFLKL